MECPYFVDFVRECQEKIENVPYDTIVYCDDEKHQECPFYIALAKKTESCKYIDRCCVFNKFSLETFEEFVEMTKKYCLSSNSSDCKRFQMREAGEIPASTLLPNGKILSGGEPESV